VDSLRLGKLLFAPLRIRTVPTKLREPDVVFMLNVNKPRRGGKFWRGADLVIEVVSDDPQSRERDLDEKRVEYAVAGISEYWMIDPQARQITILRLLEGTYAEHGVFTAGQQASFAFKYSFPIVVDKEFDMACVARADDQPRFWGSTIASAVWTMAKSPTWCCTTEIPSNTRCTHVFTHVFVGGQLASDQSNEPPILQTERFYSSGWELPCCWSLR
jgi:hypothetical protein